MDSPSTLDMADLENGPGAVFYTALCFLCRYPEVWYSDMQLHNDNVTHIRHSGQYPIWDSFLPLFFFLFMHMLSQHSACELYSWVNKDIMKTNFCTAFFSFNEKKNNILHICAYILICSYNSYEVMNSIENQK